jgi:histone-lysine N-methyltransferase SETMAR
VKHIIRPCMQYEFKQGTNATVAIKHITDVYGNDSLDVRKCQRWFHKFRKGDLSWEDDQRPGRPVEFDEHALSPLVEVEPCQLRSWLRSLTRSVLL